MAQSKDRSPRTERLWAILGPGETLFEEVKKASGDCAVESGSVDLLVTEEGRERILATYYPGATFRYGGAEDVIGLTVRAREDSAVVIDVDLPEPETPPRPRQQFTNGRTGEVLRRQLYQPGRLLFSEGAEGDTAYIIESGEVEVFRTVQGADIRLGVVGAGAILGEMALVDDQPRMASARALQSTTAVTIGRALFETKVAGADPFIRKLLKVFTHYIRLHAEYYVNARNDLNGAVNALLAASAESDPRKLRALLDDYRQAADTGAEAKRATG